MKNIAIIPARSGSKGLKNKNIKLLNGKPLLAYTIEAALSSKLFEEVMVSTDSNEYARIAKNYGAKVPFLRSDSNSSDKASSWDVVREVLSEYKKMGMTFANVVLLQPTSPLRDENDIINCFKFFKEKNADFVESFCEMDHSPIWANTLPEDKSLRLFRNEKYKGKGRQELPTFYRENGAIYIIKTDILFSSNDFFMENSYAFIMEKKKSIDIDDELDFLIAETIIKRYK